MRKCWKKSSNHLSWAAMIQFAIVCRDFTFFHRRFYGIIFAISTAVGRVLHYLVLRWDIQQFPSNNLVAAGMHCSATYRADTFFLQQLINDLLCRQFEKIQFPFPRLFFLLYTVCSKLGSAALGSANVSGSLNSEVCSSSSTLFSLDGPNCLELQMTLGLSSQVT